MGIDYIEELSSLGFSARGIKKRVDQYYGVKSQVSTTSGETEKRFYPYYRDSVLVAWKERIVTTKSFRLHGDTEKLELFGKNMCGSGKMLVITEGEEDCLAAYQMFLDNGKDYKVVSLPNGANANSIKNNLEWIESFENVVLCFDQDEKGQKAVKSCAERISPGKVKIMTLTEKDPNAMLLAGKVKEFLKSLYTAKEYLTAGIVAASDTWDLVNTKDDTICTPWPSGWDELNEKTYGIRCGELDTFTSGSGSGKTQLLRELTKHLKDITESNIGIIALEEPLRDSINALISLELNKRIHLPDVRATVSDQDYRKAWEATAGSGRYYLYDHFGSVDDVSLVNKIRYMANGLDCKYILLDHLSIVISEFANEGDERKNIDSLMSKLKRLTQELDVWIGLVVHLRKASGTPFELGAVPTVDDLRGSGSIKQLSNSVYAIARNQQAPSLRARNTSSVHVLKCRFTGSTGPAGYLNFDPDTGRMNPIHSNDVDEFLLGDEDSEY